MCVVLLAVSTLSSFLSPLVFFSFSSRRPHHDAERGDIIREDDANNHNHNQPAAAQQPCFFSRSSALGLGSAAKQHSTALCCVVAKHLTTRHPTRPVAR